jgi:hypothetical protein
VLARGGIPTNELAEWLAVQRRHENPEADTVLRTVEAATALEPAEGADLTDGDSAALEPYSAESAATPDDAATVAADTAAQRVDVLAALATEPEPEPSAPTPSNRRILARGRGLPFDNGLRPL